MKNTIVAHLESLEINAKYLTAVGIEMTVIKWI